MKRIIKYDPRSNKYPYPDITDHHYLPVPHKCEITFDENYPYIDNSKGFRFKRKLVRFLLHIIVFPMTKIKLGLRVIGKKNLKKHKQEIKQGMISVSNHVHMWDYLAVMRTFRWKPTYILSWSENILGPSRTLVRLVGGIPIPTESVKGMEKFNEAIHDLLANKGWLHIDPEASMWELYRPIRPFKIGAAHIAIMNNKPILPLGFSYRRPGWIRRKIFKQEALFTIAIGEPIYANDKLDYMDRIKDLTKRAHEAVCRLAGFRQGENIYPPIYEENSPRIDYYTEDYGKGYKTSR